MFAHAKAIGIVGFILAVSLGTLYVASQFLIEREITLVEKREVSKNTSQIVDALHERVNQIDVKARDWSSWDDAYGFVKDSNETFKESNLQSGSLARLGINFMLFFDKNGQLVTSKGVDPLDSTDQAVPADLLAAFKPSSKLLASSDNDSYKGFLDLSKGPLFFAAKPILTSENSGPYAGTLVFARYLDGTEVQHLANLTHLAVEYISIKDPTLTDQARDTIGKVTATNPYVVPLTAQTVAGYQVVNDVYDKPFLLASVQVHRDTYIEVQRALSYYLGVVMVVITCTTILVGFMSRQLVAKDKTIQLKNEFFAIASHELRTPLTAIKSNAQMLQLMYADANDSSFGEMVDDIKISCERLVRLVTGFLNAAKLEEGKLPLDLQLTALDEPIQEVVDELRGVGKGKNVELQSTTETKGLVAIADRDALKQILYNIAGNALKFTDQGSVTIDTRSKDGYVTIRVIDTGPGLSDNNKKSLFEKFQHSAKSNVQSGSGLGLYITKTLVEKMNGTIQLESSELGKGTTISFSLPLEKKV